MKVPLLIGFTLLFADVFAAVPAYIEVCGKRNPNIDQCILDSVAKLVPKLRDGIPELEVPPLEPLLFDRLYLANLTNFKAYAQRVNLFGLSDFHVDKLHIDFENRQIDVTIVFKEVKLIADYYFDAKILVPLSGTGPIQLITPDVKADVTLKYNIIKRKNKMYMYFHTMTIDLTLTGYTATFNAREGKGGDQNALSSAVNTVLVENQAEVLENAKPSLETVISQKILDLSNTICKHFTFDELFPDRS